MSETVGLVQQFVERTGQLYSLPAVAADVLRLSSEPGIEARALKECIERDPALTARILRVVNSSLFGVSRPVSDLNQAVALLGSRPLKMLVLGFSLPKELFAGLEARVLGRYWRRTLIKAVAARELAERFFKTPGDEAFIAGLVQNIGMLALIQHLGESYLQFLDRVEQQGRNLLARELESLGFDHVVLSSRLLAHWGLPQALCRAVAAPADAARIAELPPNERTLPEILHLAELLAQVAEQPYGVALRDLLQAGKLYCRLTYDQLQPLATHLQQQVEDLAEVLALELPDDQKFSDLLAASQAQLASETAEWIQSRSRAPEEELLALASRMQSELAVACGKTAPAPPCKSPPADAGNTRRTEPFANYGSTSPRRTTTVHPVSRATEPLPATAAVAAPAPTDDPALVGRVAAAIQRCRQFRCPVSLALLEIDAFSDVLVRLGPTKTTDLVHRLRLALADWTSQRTAAVLISDSSFALVWEDCPRSEAVRLVRQALASVKGWSHAQSDAAATISLSAGLATIEFPPKNFPAPELVRAAERCLGGAQLSGGDSVKSIEL